MSWQSWRYLNYLINCQSNTECRTTCFIWGCLVKLIQWNKDPIRISHIGELYVYYISYIYIPI
jgi:hypothetical protein